MPKNKKDFVLSILVFGFALAIVLSVFNGFIAPRLWPKDEHVVVGLVDKNQIHPSEAIIIIEVSPDSSDSLFQAYYGWPMWAIRQNLTREGLDREYEPGRLLPWYAWALHVRYGQWEVRRGDSLWHYNGTVEQVKKRGIPVELSQNYGSRFVKQKADTK